ncbi:hypothetical protein [Pedobacter psychrodurus]|uniref:hypothetical protein n=1 Tax=Pedobacter psychrodurus TaxID=2530456 RepID=UPI00292E7403|nr:hypothetical protein [Pedobacter psychrodurus]
MDSLETLKGGGDSDDTVDGGELDEVVITPDPDDDIPPLDPDPEPDEDPFPDEDEENPWDDGDWDDHGDGAETEDQDEEEEDTPCEKAKAAGEQAMNTLNSSSVQASIAHSVQLPTALGQEAFFTITKDSNGVIGSSTAAVGTAWGVSGFNYADSIADFHTHPNSNYPPGGADIITFLRDRLNGSSNLETSFIQTQNGTTYALQVTDSSLMEDFFNDFSGNVKDGNWDGNSTVGVMFRDAEEAFKSQGLSVTDAFARATSYIAERAGLTLFKADATQTPYLPNSFSKVGVSTSTENGVLKYQISDCPN